MTQRDFDEGYHGSAELFVGATVHSVTVRLSGHFEPIDGRFHWGGRISPNPAVAALLRAGRRAVRLRTVGGQPADGRLTELDPWGGVRVTGVGPPPFAPSTVDH